PWDDYYGAGSPLERFVAAGGRVLRLGADLDTVTVIHYAEYLVDLPEKRRVRRHRAVTSPVGTIVRTVDCLDDFGGIVDPVVYAHYGEDYFATILKAYLAAGRAITGTVGDARTELIDAADIVAFATDWMRENLRA
ncbi:AAC(3) family N-acetyltransferase, partial [Xanthomonas citri pv. citri]